MTRRCDQCQFYRELHQPTSPQFPSDGECRVRSVLGEWPHRLGDEWCGEFSAAASPPKKYRIQVDFENGLVSLVTDTSREPYNEDQELYLARDIDRDANL